MNNQPNSKARQVLAGGVDESVPTAIPSTRPSAPENSQQGKARYANEKPCWPPARHHGPLPNDPLIRASIAQANAAGFPTCTSDTWALAQTLGLGPADLHQLDGIADLA